MEESNKVGRPTEYKPEYIEELLRYAQTGKSYRAFAGFIGVSHQTLYDWEKKHPEFLDAKQRFVSMSQDWWEEQAIQSLFDSTGFNTKVWTLYMKNRFGWKEKIEQDITTTQAIAINVDKDDLEL